MSNKKGDFQLDTNFKKRLAAYMNDLMMTLGATIFLSIGSLGLMGLIAIFFSKSENVNTVFLWMIVFFLFPVLLGAMQFTYGASFKVKQRKLFSQKVDVLFDFSQTRGQKRQQLRVKGTQWQCFLHWFLHYGIISMLVYASSLASMVVNSFNNVFTGITCLYIVFLLVNGIIFYRASPSKSLIERITGTEIVEVE